MMLISNKMIGDRIEYFLLSLFSDDILWV